jgi:hypothetical protein
MFGRWQLVADLELESFWHAFRFKSDEQEEEFFERELQNIILGCRCWSITQLLVYAALFFPEVQFEYGAEFYLSFIPSFVIFFGAVLVSFPPLQRKTERHLMLIMSIAIVLQSICSIWQTQFFWQAYSSWVFDHDLGSVTQHMSGDSEALGQIHRVVDKYMGELFLNQEVALGVPHALLVIYMGFYRSTFWTTVLVPVLWLISTIRSPHMSAVAVFSRLVIFALSWAFVVALTIHVSLTRRSQFVAACSYQSKLKIAVEGSRKADSILNHTLKNTMADAAGEIALFLQSPSLDNTFHLQQSYASLRRGMRSCRHRQVYWQLAMNAYAPTLRPIRCMAFGRELTVGRDVQLVMENVVAWFDETLLCLILDNGLSNAFKYGDPQSPNVGLSMATSAPLGTTPGKQRVTFMVTNRAHPQRPPLTKAFVDSFRNPDNHPQPLPKDALGLCSAMSDQIGLQHAFLAAEAHGMELSLVQVGDQVTFEAQFEAQFDADVSAQLEEDPLDNTCSDDPTAFPEDLEVCILDDSPSARRLVAHGVQTWGHTQNVRVFGDDPASAQGFVDAVKATAHIVILDQHLEYGGNVSFLGTDIAHDLLASGYRGLLCVRSGNVAEEDLWLYFTAGAHGVFGKDEVMRDMMMRIKALYVRHIVKGLPVDCHHGPQPPNLLSQAGSSSASTSTASPIRKSGLGMSNSTSYIELPHTASRCQTGETAPRPAWSPAPNLR